MNKQVRNWLIVSLIIGGFISLLASSHPDGFEKSGEQVGFIEKASTSLLSSPLPDYAIPGVESWISGSAAGLIGVALTFGAFLLLGRLITSRSKP
jgi:cobalt/nickel transport protein